MVLDPLDIHLWKQNEPADSYLTSHVQISLKRIIDLDIKAKTIKLRKKLKIKSL